MRMGLGTAILLLAAPVAFFALFFAGPFLVLAVESLSDRSGAPTAQHYVSVLDGFLLLEGAREHAPDLAIRDRRSASSPATRSPIT